MRSITILGATGSIGASTLDLIRRNRADWRVVALTARSQVGELASCDPATVHAERTGATGGCEVEQPRRHPHPLRALRHGEHDAPEPA